MPFKAVFDTNVLVSGIVHAGKSKLLIDAVLEGKISLVLSKQIVQEFRRVIARDKFRLSKSQQDMLTNFVAGISDIVRVKSRFKIIEEDPNDDIVLRTAYDAKAEYVVSGDEHLLSLKEFRRMKIITISEMLELITPSH